MRSFMAFVMLVTSSVSWAQGEIATPQLLRANQLQAPVDQAALQRQYDALRKMNLNIVEYSPRGPVTNIAGETGIILPADSSARTKGSPAPDFLQLFADVLLATGTESLTVRDNWTMYGTERGLEFSQSIRGIPVVNGGVSVSYDAETNRVSSLVAHFVPDRNLPRAPKLSAMQAEEMLRKALVTGLKQGAKVHIREGAFKAYFADFADPSAPALDWVIRALTASEAELFGDEEFYVDATSGRILSRRSMRLGLGSTGYSTRRFASANCSAPPRRL
jgi:hypothetical protein